MIIYEQEKKDGLEKAISSNLIVAYTTLARAFSPTPEVELKVKASVNPEQQHLFYLDSVLASIGWNANDDVFSKEETFNARATPINKPFNFMHNEADIIGHIIGSSILDENGKIIANSEELAVVPDKYDILSQSVLYKVWADKALQERMDKIIAEIAEGKWFVSMECLFSGFDYAVITPEGEHRIVARNAESAFLTKHLRVYGGTGSYENNKVGRLLRNFAFSGKGLVDNPANKRSIIFTDTNKFNGASASVKIFNKGKLMDELIKAQLDETKKLLEVARSENANLVAKANDEAKKLADAKATEVAQTLAAKEESIKAAKKVAEEAEAAKVTAETALKTEQEKVSVLAKEIAAMKAEAAKIARLAKLATAGVTGEEATKLFDKFASATEEMFDEFVALTTAVKKGGNDKITDKKTNDDDSDDKKSKADDTTTDDAGEKAAAAAKLEELKTKEAALSAGASDKTQELRTAASNWISSNVLKSTAKLNK